MVCNFPSILRSYQERGWKAEYLAPAHDPAMEEYASNDDRPIDVLFVGGYSRHHTKRAAVLEAIAGLRHRYRIEFCLACSRLTRLAESALGYLAPVGKYRRPSHIRAVSCDPAYGRDLYSRISRAKIVLNGAIDMSGDDRGNMRCFESMGCRGLLLSDEGVYPAGMVGGQTLVTYQSPADLVVKLRELLEAPGVAMGIAQAGHDMVTRKYSKQVQWSAFEALVSNIYWMWPYESETGIKERAAEEPIDGLCPGPSLSLGARSAGQHGSPFPVPLCIHRFGRAADRRIPHAHRIKCGDWQW
jgi:hypothetical protein